MPKPLAIPAEFFYSLPQERRKLTNRPTGEIDTQAVLQNKDCIFIEPALDRQPHSKKLILADWSAQYWSAEKIADAQEVFAALLDKGFSLYIEQHGKIVPLLKKDLSSLQEKCRQMSTVANMSVDLPTILAAPTLPPGFTRDGSYLLDYYRFQPLLREGKAVAARRLYASDYSALSEQEKKILLTQLQQNEKPEEIVHNEFSDAINRLLPTLKGNFPTVACIQEYDSVKLNTLFYALAVNDKEERILCGATISLSQVGKITSLFLSTKNAPTAEFEILLTSPFLKKLSLRGYTDFNCVFYAHPPGSLPGLEILDLSQSNIVAARIQALLLATSYLKKLNLRTCQNIQQAILALPEKSLPYLEEVDLTDTDITIEALQALLLAAPHLKKLNLTNCEDIHGDMPALEKESLFHLKELNLSCCSMTIEDLQTLLRAAPHLEKLNLYNCENIPTFEDAHLWHLREIKLAATEITLTSVQALLRAAPQLKKLNLSGCNNIPGNMLGLSPDSFPYLEALNLCGNPITIAGLQVLSRAAPQLRELNLSSCEDISGDMLGLPPDSFPYLEALDLYWSPITIAGLQVLSRAAPQLRELNLSSCEDISGDMLELLPNLFPHLEVLDISSTTITLAGLETLLKAAPRLKELRIEYCLISQEDIDTLRKERPQLIIVGNPKAEYTESRVEYPKAEYTESSVEDSKAEYTESSVEDPKAEYTESSVEDPEEIKAEAPLPVADPVHDANAFITFEPTSKDAPFQFTGKNTTKNQEMVIEKLSQYILLSGKDSRIIPTLQDGMCNALSYYFVDVRISVWEKCIEDIAAWDGQYPISADLDLHFSILLRYIQDYQFGQKIPAPHKQYLGENLPYFLENMQDSSSCVLINPWHAIGITRLSAQEWHIYDPNFPAGCKKNISYDSVCKIIETSMGKIVGVSSNQPFSIPPTAVSDLDTFLQEGGLFPLIRYSHTQHILQQIEAHPSFSCAALEKGLSIRSAKGKPAWVSGIETPHTKALTEKLLTQFRDTHPGGAAAAKKVLEKSIQALPAAEKKTHGKFLATFFPQVAAITPPPLDQKGADESAAWTDYYTEKLTTWETQEALADNLDDYAAECLTDKVDKRLIEVTSPADLHGLRFALQAKATEIGRPLFYIHTPEELTCLGIALNAEGYPSGEKHGGELYRFLNRHRDDSPLLVIDYDNFSSDDIARLNTVINAEKSMDNVALPEGTQIIGLINTGNPDCYQGADFHGRFTQKECCPISSEIFQKEMQTLQLAPRETIKKASGKRIVINLFQDADWKQILLGKWMPAEYTERGQRFAFQEGALHHVKPGDVIEIQNGPYDSAEYQLFWKDLEQKGTITYEGRRICLTGRIFSYEGRTIDLSGCRFLHSEGYGWDTLQTHFQHLPYTDLPERETTILTPQHLHLLLGGTQLNPETTGFSALEGKIALQGKKQDTSLRVYVTRTLSKDQWAKLLTECQKHHVRLQVQCAPGVTLPAELESAPAVLEKKEEEKEAAYWTEKVTPTPTHIITSTDLDTTVALLQQEEKWDIYLDISELNAADLLTRVQRTKDADGNNTFTEKECALLTALKAGKNILLRGSCSPALADQLAPLLIQRFQETHAGAFPPGRLCIVTHPPAKTATASPFQYVPSPYQYQHVVTADEKLRCLKKRTRKVEEISAFLEEPLAKLQARYNFLAQFPEAKAEDSSKIWDNLYRLPGFLAKPAPFDPARSPEQAAAFHAARKNAFDAALEYRPYVLLLGFSGVGKTTFVQGLQTENDSLEIVGTDLEKSLYAWKNSTAKGKRRLFIDEATLHPSDWTRFESLFHAPPGILIEGEYFTLPSEDSPYEVIFAGNPLSYSADRKAASLFERHGNTLVFDPLPPAVLYADVLQPLFEGQPFTPQVIEAISAHFLEVYRFLVGCSETDVLISPRELEMMALLTLSYCAQPENAQVDPTSVAKHYAFSLAKNGVPEAFASAFHRQFMPDTPFQPLHTDRSDDFLITPSRERLSQKIDEWLALRAWRQENSAILNPKQRYGGLGGITIEGEPGIGKSDLILNRLHCHGFQKRSDAEIDLPVAPGEKIFYLMQQPTREALIKACQQKAVVVIDEANSSPGMEDLLNRLLMEGLMVIYTQNPAKTTQGRRATSTASARRHYTETLPVYPTNEMESVLLHKKLPLVQTKALITAFETNTKKALLEKRAPLPSFRHVLREAEETLDRWQKAAHAKAFVMPPPGFPHFDSGFFITEPRTNNSSHFAGSPLAA